MSNRQQILVQELRSQLQQSLNMNELLRLMESFGFIHMKTTPEGCGIYQNRDVVVFMARHSQDPALVGQILCAGSPGSGNESFKQTLVADDRYVA